MATRIVTFELSHPSDKTNYDGFFELLRGYDHTFLTAGSCAVATDEYPEHLFAKLFPFIDDQDALAVIAVTRFYMAHHDSAVLDWMARNV
jgi:hypothetical protein